MLPLVRGRRAGRRKRIDTDLIRHSASTRVDRRAYACLTWLPWPDGEGEGAARCWLPPAVVLVVVLASHRRAGTRSRQVWALDQPQPSPLAEPGAALAAAARRHPAASPSPATRSSSSTATLRRGARPRSPARRAAGSARPTGPRSPAAPATPVVVAGKLLTKGYEVLDPRDRRGAPPRHRGLGRLDLPRRDARRALLRARATAQLTRAGTRAAHAAVDGRPARHRLRPVRRQPRPARHQAADGRPDRGRRPAARSRCRRCSGFPIDGKVHIVDTAAGPGAARTIEPDRRRADRRRRRPGAADHRRAAADGTCYYRSWPSTRPPASEVWRNAGINLRTTNGAGCDQRDDPAGGRERGGRRRRRTPGRWSSTRTTAGRALARRAGRATCSVDDGPGARRSPPTAAPISGRTARRWPAGSARSTPTAQVALTRYAAIVLDQRPDRIIALNPVTGAELVNVRSTPRCWRSARRAGHRRRPRHRVPPVPRHRRGRPVAGRAGGDDPAAHRAPVPARDGPVCGGPKQESCRSADARLA